MPFIIFQPYKYNLPLPGISVLTNGKNKEAYPNMDEVALYMPGDFSETVNARWGAEDVMQGGGGNVLATLTGNAVSMISEKTQGGGKILASGKAATGKLPYPMDINIFQSVEPMNFNLAFNMIPYDDKEGAEIIKIITLFKRAILPTGNVGNNSIDNLNKNVVLDFPAIWDLTFSNIKGIGLSKSEDKYENMCLTNCTVSYVSGTESASVYEDDVPTHIKMNLSFQSLRKHYLDS